MGPVLGGRDRADGLVEVIMRGEFDRGHEEDIGVCCWFSVPVISISGLIHTAWKLQDYLVISYMLQRRLEWDTHSYMVVEPVPRVMWKVLFRYHPGLPSLETAWFSVI
jgi:hypothetical protein